MYYLLLSACSEIGWVCDSVCSMCVNEYTAPVCNTKTDEHVCFHVQIAPSHVSESDGTAKTRKTQHLLVISQSDVLL